MTAEHCGTCGYLREYHKGALCPVERGGRQSGKWSDRPPPEPYISPAARMQRDYEARVAKHKAETAPYVPVVVPPPRIPARPVAGPGELAAGQGRQALGLGRKATAAGWTVRAFYALAHDGTEMCAVRLARGDLAAVAIWRRPAPLAGTKGGWAADIAYGWQDGTMPTKITHTQLEGIISAS